MMATPENGTDVSSDLDIEALINADVDESAVSAVVSSLHQELNSVKVTQLSQDSGLGSIDDSAMEASNGHSGNPPPAGSTIDLTQPVKTQGETSSVSLTSTTTSHNLTLNLTSTALKSNDTNRRPSLSMMSPFGTITPQSPNSQLLTPEEQSALYKQASLLAIHSLFNKNGAVKAKERLAVVTKVKNFLTNLIQLAGNSGPEVKQTVHSLVQKLVAGNITEEEFAEKIEHDLQSKHQPGLLPFLKSSVQDLRIHLQLQKEYMRQLIEKKFHEKSSSQSPQTDQPLPPTNSETEATPQNTPMANPVVVSTVPSTTPTATPTASIVSKTAQQKTVQSPETPKAPPKAGSSPAHNLALLGMTPAQQQALKLQLAKMPEDQRKTFLERFIYQKQLQIQNVLANQKKKASSTSTATGGGALTTALNVGGVAKNLTTQQQLSVILRQQQLIKEQQQQAASIVLNNQGSLQLLNKQSSSPAANVSSSAAAAQKNSSPKKSGLSGLLGKVKGGNSKDDSPSSPGKSRVVDEEEDDEGMDIAGVNLKEETAHFLPSNIAETTSLSCPDETFISLSTLRTKVHSIACQYGIGEISEDYLKLLSHATEERLKNLIEKVTVVNQHRSENLKDNGRYEVTNDVRGQMKVLERIDEISSSRKQEREKEKIFRAAKSRSKQDDPELAKMKEQAKQIQIAEEREIHQRAANELALAAIGRRKRTATSAFGPAEPSKSNGTVSDSSNGAVAGLNSVFSSPSSTRTRQKRRIQSKDVMFVMEQERELKHTSLLYKSYIS